MVRVRDRTLGILNYSLTLLIFAYIAVKVLYIDAGYYAHDSPIGSARITLKMPSDGIDLTKETYCPNSPDYAWGFPDELGFPCLVWDEHSVRYPLDELDAAFVTTRVSITEQEYLCGSKNTIENPRAEDSCKSPFSDPEQLNSKHYFLGGVREYTFGIQHSFYAPMFTSTDAKRSERYRGTSANLYGKLVDDKGKQLVTFPPTTGGIPDVITVGAIMDAANIDITRKSPDPHNSVLYSGILTLVLISYENSSDENMQYTYRAQSIPDSDFKVYQVTNSVYKTSRTLLKHAGPKFVFIVTGDIVRFDLQTLIIQLVSAMGLLSFAVIMVDLVMVYIMPSRAQYSEAKFHITKRFSEEESDSEMSLLEAGQNLDDPYTQHVQQSNI